MVIPAHREEVTIGPIVRAALRWGRVIVVDDGSADRTAQRAAEAGAWVVRHPFRRGKGAALRSGWSRAVHMGATAVATLDGDGQHDPDELGALWEAYERTGADLVIGVRARSPAMPRARRWANGAAGALVALLGGRAFGDVQCGMRVVRLGALQALLPRARGFAVELEMLVRFLRAGRRVVSVSVSTRYGGRPSHIRPLWDPATVAVVAAWSWLS